MQNVFLRVQYLYDVLINSPSKWLDNSLDQNYLELAFEALMTFSGSKSFLVKSHGLPIFAGFLFLCVLLQA